MAELRLRSSTALCFLLCAAILTVERLRGAEADPSLITETHQVGPLELTPGGIGLEWFRIQIPQFHFSLRSIKGDIVDENGEPAPLHDVYLHHWVIQRYFQAVGGDSADGAAAKQAPASSAEETAAAAATPRWSFLPLASGDGADSPFPPGPAGTVYPNAGFCRFAHVFAVGAETRHTAVTFPAPYGVEGQDPAVVPPGHTEAWFAEVHLIDLRGARDARACLECQCAAYNVSTTMGRYARFMPEGYRGGLFCCSDTATRCQVEEGFAAPPKKYFLRYTLQYVRHTPCAVPLRVYFMDAFFKDPSDGSSGCGIEYSMDDCLGPLAGCIDTRERRVRFPAAGRVVFAVGHQHVGAMGVSLHRAADGSAICESRPIYGQGRGAGDEAGFVVGMRPCKLGGAGEEVRVAANETLVLRATYSRRGGHTGVMSILFIAFAADEDYVRPEGSLCRLAARQPPYGQAET